MAIEKEGPIEENMRKVMNDIGRLIGGAIKQSGDNYGFTLLVFKFGQGDDHIVNYISNANREDMLATMKEFIARAEGRFEDFTKRKI